MEIALKIASKIRAHERFAVYIIIPMWPEGNPTGAATQRILFWQVGSSYDLNSYIIVCDTFFFFLKGSYGDGWPFLGARIIATFVFIGFVHVGCVWIMDLVIKRIWIHFFGPQSFSFSLEIPSQIRDLDTAFMFVMLWFIEFRF